MDKSLLGPKRKSYIGQGSGPRKKLCAYAGNDANKKYEFWKWNLLTIPLFTHKEAVQKLKYNHNNPLAEHWQLVKKPCDYKYSSARYYGLDEKTILFLKDLLEVI